MAEHPEAPSDDKETTPSKFRPEGAEIEPAGGILGKPPAPQEPRDTPTEGDRR